MTRHEKNKFLKAFETSYDDLAWSCKQAGVTRTELMLEVQDDPEFSRKIWEIHEGFIDAAISMQLKLGIGGDAKCLNDFLVAHGKNRGYSKEDPGNLPTAYSDIIKPTENEKPEDKVIKQVQHTSTEDLEKALKNLKKIKC